MFYIVEMFTDMVGDIIAALPLVIAAIIIVLIGYAIGIIAGNAANKIVEKLGIEKSFDKMNVRFESLTFIDAGANNPSGLRYST